MAVANWLINIAFGCCAFKSWYSWCNYFCKSCWLGGSGSCRSRSSCGGCCGSGGCCSSSSSCCCCCCCCSGCCSGGCSGGCGGGRCSRWFRCSDFDWWCVTWLRLLYNYTG